MKLTVAGIDVSGFAIYSITASTGRDDIYNQPDSTSCAIEFIDYQSAGAVGDEIILSDDVGQIFRGWITDIKAELQEDMSWKTGITATGPLALLGQFFAGFAAYPVESDTQRVIRILDETPIGSYLQTDPVVEGFALAPRLEETEPENAAELARLAADSAMGVLWEQPNSFDKPLRYTQAKYRTWDAYALVWGELPPTAAWSRADLAWGDVDSDTIPVPNAPPLLVLDPAVTYADLVFEQTIDDLVRSVKVSYGPNDLEEEQPVVVMGGELAPSKSFTTILDSFDDATSYAFVVLDRQSFPAWRLSSVSMDLGLMPPARQVEIRNALQVGTRLIIDMPHGSPVGTTWQGFLEGWELTLESDGTDELFIVDMNVSDRFMTEPADRWSEFPETVQWQAIDDNIRWMDTTDVASIGGA